MPKSNVLTLIKKFAEELDPTKEDKNKDKDIVLFINEIRDENVEAVKKLGKILKKKLKLAVIRDSRLPSLKENGNSNVDLYIDCDLYKPLKIAEALAKYQERIMVVSCREERQILNFAKVIPHLPYLNAPTDDSLIRSTDKLMMRQYLFNYDKEICPKFIVATGSNKSSIKEIKEKVGFPLVIKPAGLASSLLVTICFHEEELEKSLNTVFKKINSIYKENKRKEEPKVLVEKFLDGEQYSIDAYVSAAGKIIFCPTVNVKTGRSIGFDDFFGYTQITPTLLNNESEKEAQVIAAKSVLALGLRSTTVHIELMKTEAGWKVIEAGARMGGFRHQLYQLSYNFDHALNDLLVRIPKQPVVRKTVKGYSAVLKFYPKNEGVLSQLLGVIKIKELSSYHGSKTNKKIGERCNFAKNGGKCVLELILFNKKRSGLLADIRRTEKAIQIATE